MGEEGARARGARLWFEESLDSISNLQTERVGLSATNGTLRQVGRGSQARNDEGLEKDLNYVLNNDTKQ